MLRVLLRASHSQQQTVEFLRNSNLGAGRTLFSPDDCHAFDLGSCVRAGSGRNQLSSIVTVHLCSCASSTLKLTRGPKGKKYGKVLECARLFGSMCAFLSTASSVLTKRQWTPVSKRHQRTTWCRASLVLHLVMAEAMSGRVCVGFEPHVFAWGRIPS